MTERSTIEAQAKTQCFPVLLTCRLSLLLLVGASIVSPVDRIVGRNKKQNKTMQFDRCNYGRA